MSAASRMFDVPLIVTEHYSKALGKTVSEIDVSGATIFQKTKFSMMTSDVSHHLENLARKKVVLFGIEAHVCILQTTLDLIEKGYEVHILADGTSSSRDWERAIAFQRLRESGAILTTSETVLFELMGEKEHPQFKNVSALIKEPRPDAGLSSNL
eukprot:CAMPEP_0201491162 /NCGR_PEP_ID=MMETSP0151_2-20130828/28806_1 /ASSEMBLY_ACC=CAM_ASM_000257 /TAXON_ID=200890 /ORGANISM="Paramoeba atlantica, Strain 621/1 / CCAP 1560/9" /LENGTH=154 /DNA_ID=CAMNT_0047877389 /DNA_START=175 /DNA_END=639 /DNA_ORIENTATION=+